jgi:hypothetical protein
MKANPIAIHAMVLGLGVVEVAVVELTSDNKGWALYR